MQWLVFFWLLALGYSTSMLGNSASGVLGRDAEFDLEFFQHKKAEDAHSDCVSLTEAARSLIDRGFESRLMADKVYVARRNIGIQVGKLIPSLNFGAAVGATGGSFFELVPSVVGFLFPSNWYNWKAAKYLYEAHRYSYQTMLGNGVQALTSLYYTLHAQLEAFDIISYYLNQIEYAIKRARWQRERFGREINPEMMGMMKSIRARMRFDRTKTKETLAYSYAQLAYVINREKSWTKLCIRRHEIAPPYLDPPPASKKLMLHVFDRSSELASLSFAKKSAMRSYRGRNFSFMDPESENFGLGLSFAHDIKISRRNLESLDTRFEETRASLRLALLNTLARIKFARNSFLFGLDSRSALEGPRLSFKENMEDMDSLFDLERPLRYFEYTLTAELRINQARHDYAVAQDELHRLLWSTPHYQMVREAIPRSKIQLMKSEEWFKNIDLAL